MRTLLFQILKYASLPLAILYGLIIWIRNLMYNKGWMDSISFDLPVICVGNITVGGTGKSPHIEYLIEHLQGNYPLATISRGYKRRSRGFKIADAQSNARDIGDEPFQFKSKYPLVEVCVAEERMTAIPQLLQAKPLTKVILLDDAFQHRTVQAGMNILLTDYDRLFTRDFIMPFGLLRESRQAYKRANIIIVTKCPQQLSVEQKQQLIDEINPIANQHIYFSSIQYKELYPLTSMSVNLNANTHILLITGIANPKPLQQYLSATYTNIHLLSYPDHHYFTVDDIAEMVSAFQHIQSANKAIITTEKDASRLMLHQEKLIDASIPLYAQAIAIDFLFNEADNFNAQISSFVASFYPSNIQPSISDEFTDDIIFEEVLADDIY